MYKITKEFHFCASHQLEGLPKEHPCTRLHGHNYVIKVECTKKHLNDVGFVLDYRQMESLKEYIETTLDHKHLNDVFSFNPTAENMAKYFFNVFAEMISYVSAVEVSETPKTNARYEPTDN